MSITPALREFASAQAGLARRRYLALPWWRVLRRRQARRDFLYWRGIVER